MRYRGVAVLVVALATVSSLGCRKREGRPLEVLDLRVRTAILTPHPRAGWPVLVRYTWSAGGRFRAIDHPVRAFVHCLSSDGATVINDDHAPELDWARMQPGEAVSYERVVFPPEQFPGRLAVQVGLFDTSTGRRFGLGAPRDAEDVASIVVMPASVPSRDRTWSGFYFPDGDPANPFVMSRWMGQEAEVVLPAVVGDGLLVLRAWTDPTAFGRDPTLTIAIGEQQAKHTIKSETPFVLALPVPVGHDAVRVRLRMNGTFVPAPPDTRRLGLCVTNLALLPRAYLAGAEVSDAPYSRSYP